MNSARRRQRHRPPLSLGMPTPLAATGQHHPVPAAIRREPHRSLRMQSAKADFVLTSGEFIRSWTADTPRFAPRSKPAASVREGGLRASPAANSFAPGRRTRRDSPRAPNPPPQSAKADFVLHQRRIHSLWKAGAPRFAPRSKPAASVREGGLRAVVAATSVAPAPHPPSPFQLSSSPHLTRPASVPHRGRIRRAHRKIRRSSRS
jgi:hypothetical protein